MQSSNMVTCSSIQLNSKFYQQTPNLCKVDNIKKCSSKLSKLTLTFSPLIGK